jgi:eukaryotic-like serine/threonine-protein kinase
MERSRRPGTADTIAVPDASVKPELADTQIDGQPRERNSSPVLGRGAPIGRYIVIEQLGAGGMGTVYVAYDPELDRKVAVKVLKSDGEGADLSAGRARMMREAQAIARLAHPNVVTVYDVGPIAEHQVFIAMELVEGTTLAKWRDERDRTLAEILDVFVQAGRGLAAAHSAGLVHRDFKPDNVLVGKDGRARVADFGLVREVDAAPEPEEESSSRSSGRSSLLSMSLTQVGTMMGTPRYMAPEQRNRGAVDARSDQYSFCVALHEALHGRLPSNDTDPAVPEGDAPAPSPVTRSVPGAIRAAIQRGLSDDPAKRWPSMNALVAELARDPYARRRTWLVAGGAVLALGGVAAVIAVASSRTKPGAECAGAGERLADVWSPRQRKSLERAFASTHAPYAAASFTTVARELDAYAEAWRRSYEDSCRATHVRHDQSTDLLDLRTTCLTGRRDALAALVSLLENKPDAALVKNAVTATAALPPVADCDDLAALQSRVRLPADPAARLAIEQARAELPKIDATFNAGRYKDALPLAVALRERTRKLAYRPLEADASLLLGKIQARVGDNVAAEQTYREALAASLAGHDDEDAVLSATSLVRATADNSQLPRAEEWLVLADALIERAGNPDLMRARYYSTHASVLTNAGRYAEAAAAHERARAIRERTMPDSMELARNLTSLAYVYDEIGEYAKAREIGDRGLAIEIAKLGPDHPEIALVYNNMGNIAADEGDNDKARDYYVKSLAIRERTVAEAGDDPRGIAMVANNLGMMALEAERYDEALTYLRRAIEVRHKLDPEDPEATLPMVGVATVLAKRKQYAEALAEFQRSLGIVEKKLTKDHPYAGDALVGIGSSQRELGRLDASQAALERALAIREHDARPVELAEVQFELAKTVWARGNKTRAVALARSAREQYATSKAAVAALASVDAWLMQH